MDTVLQIVTRQRNGQTAYSWRLFRDGTQLHDSPMRFTTEQEAIDFGLRTARQLFGVECPTVRTGRQRV